MPFSFSQISLAGAGADGVPVNHKGSLPTLAALTPIHTYLAVQYQMCVVAQLPHIVLLAATLKGITQTSLSKCVFGRVMSKPACLQFNQNLNLHLGDIIT